MDNMPERQIICHPDKIELFILNTAHNRLTLPELYPKLIKRWTDCFDLCWRHERNWHSWNINGWNDEIRLSFSGPSKDLENDSEWKRNPFGAANVLDCIPWSRRSWISILRITYKIKVDPRHYCDYLSQIFENFERIGIQEKPRIIEVALDCYGLELARFVRQTVRLTRDDPLDFCHYKDKRYCSGGSPNGSRTEYSMRGVFHRKRGEKQRQNSRRRELVCYSKSDYPIYRIELRLGYRFLERFHESETYHRAIESLTVPDLIRDYPVKVPSTTLDLLGFTPYFVRTQLVFESIDVGRFHRQRPVTRFWGLRGKSLREQRYQLSTHGLRTKAIALTPPPIRYVLPRQIDCHT